MVIDVSKYNKPPKDWVAIKNNPEVNGIIIRCGYRGYGKSGSLVVDPRFEYFRDKCKEYGIPWGVYFFPTSINVSEAYEEADFVHKLIDGENLYFPIFADSEWSNRFHTGRSDKLSKRDRTVYLIAFLEGLKKYGHNVGIYASTSWFKDNLNDSSLKGYPHWVAQYNDVCKYNGDKIGWQFSSNGNIKGFNGRVDISIWYGRIGIDKPEYDVNVIADEVIEGKWGNGDERRKRLTEAGYDYRKVQDVVNQKLKNR